MPELAIIADDLTGALDAAAPFAMHSIATAVALNPAALGEAIAGGARVIGVSTDSRDLPPAEACAAVAAALAALPAGTRLFKKVDSRLKGQIAAELDAIPHVQSLVIPAIPGFGRWVREGALGGFGVAAPVAIAARLGAHAGRASIPDIENDADITAALGIAHDLPIGARGLAEAMARAMAPNAPAPDVSLRHRRAYLVIGSTDPITLDQLAELRAADPGLVYVAAPNGVGPAELPAPARLTVLQATPGATAADGKAVAHALAETLKRLDPPPGALLVLSGGATAQVLLDRLGVEVLHLIGEALPGLPLAQGGGLTFVTKSGGFGGAETLQQLLYPFYAEEARIA
jgi:uncharacterized protein YgbK (DUF1537 family)